MEFYQKSPNQIFKELQSSPDGLSEEEAKKRLSKYGPNIIIKGKGRSAFSIFVSQFRNFLIILLVIALLISSFTQPLSHSFVLFLVIIFNVFLGFILEFKAEKSLSALRQVFPQKMVVVRGGKEKIIPVTDLVLGDIVLLAPGSRIPADLRIFESRNLEIDESSLTGESIPSKKSIKTLYSPTPLADRENMGFSGTFVTKGEGKGIVVATSSQTEMGKIAHIIAEKPEKTPLEMRLEFLGKVLAMVSIALVLFIFTLGFFHQRSIVELFNYTIALLVSAVPEGLPTVVTLSLAIGVLKMAKHKAIVRKLSAVETLSGVKIICVDKTGTLTKNEMTVKKVWIPKKGEMEIKGLGYLPEPKFKPDEDLRRLIKVGFLCNNAVLNFDEKKKRWQVIGDPTEGAFLVLGKKAGIEEGVKNCRKIKEVPFDEKRKMMSVIVKEKEGIFIYTKGAPEAILAVSALDKKQYKEAMKEIEKLTREGYRVLGFGYKKIKDWSNSFSGEEAEKGLNFLGFSGLIDPPAEGVKESIRLCQEAQIKPVIISGDHKFTTQALARQIGLEVKEENILTGEELEQYKEEELSKIIDRITIFARTSPSQKMKILSAFQKRGYQVAMTGDGINDAPALKQADIGIAMGLRGQDVAKESSDIILADDNFSTIEKAIEYARTIYDNLKKFITYLLSGCYIELTLVSIAFILNLPSPLLPLQILWIDLITETGPALALSEEKPDPLIMKEPPKDPRKSIILSALGLGLANALLGIGISWLLFISYLPLGSSLARSMVFTFVVLFELTIINSLRQKRPFWRGGFFSNKYFISAILLSILFQLIALYSPISGPLGSTPLGFSEWVLIISFCLEYFLVLEVVKYLREKKWS